MSIKRDQAEKRGSCMLPFMWNSGTGKIIGRDEKRISGCLGKRMGEGGLRHRTQGNCPREEIILILIVEVVTHVYMFIKTHQMVCCKWMRFTMYKLYLNKVAFLRNERNNKNKKYWESNWNCIIYTPLPDFFFCDKVSLCVPVWNAATQSRFTAVLISWTQASLPPQLS